MDTPIKGPSAEQVVITLRDHFLGKYSALTSKLLLDSLVTKLDGIDEVLTEMKSPIEQALYLAFINTGYKDYLYPYATPAIDIDPVIFEPQHPVEIKGKTYILDFILAMWLPDNTHLHIAIECDGHDFHEKTKEQAKRDRQRERALTAAGYIVVRFTGSEIYNDPYMCAEEIYRLAITKLKQKK